jgi:rRNA-processing protein FCF1
MNQVGTSIDLRTVFSNYKVFVDTSFLLQPAFADLYDSTLNYFATYYSNPIIIPTRVVEEVNKKAASKEPVAPLAWKAYQVVSKAIAIDKTFKAQGEESDGFADNVFLTVFTKFRRTHNLCLLTNDFKLSSDITRLKRQHSVKSQFDIACLYLDKNNSIQKFVISPRTKDKNNITQAPQEKKKIGKVLTAPFSPNVEWTIGDRLSTPDGRQLDYQFLASGGEGTIVSFSAEPDWVGKVLFPNKLVKQKYDKIKYMLQHPITKQRICWPIDGLVNADGNFVGYTMPRIVGKTLREYCFYPMQMHVADRTGLINLCLAILRTVKHLHDFKVLVGDINPDNFIVTQNGYVTIIDADSFQLHKYPCPVGTDLFTAPEIQGMNFSDFMRSIEHEKFAIAVLLFMVLLPGKHPFSQIDGESPAQNIKNKNFPYRFVVNDEVIVEGKKAPVGHYRRIWSNLSRKVKEKFIQAFVDEERPSIEEWIDVLERYKYDVGKQYVTNEIFPKNFKPKRNKET